MMLSSSSSAATVRVEKATSDLLHGPDWTMNMEICDLINTNHWDAKDVVKALKKRLQHKNPKVQLLALTLLETMVKNCGDYVHFQIADKHVLPEMTKIVKKRMDTHVRDKILVLIDSWQEAFGGPGGKYPQYYWAYEELRRAGVAFPPRSPDAAPIFTPPVAHSTMRNAQAGYGMPSNSSTRLDEAMAADVGNLSLSTINSMRNVLDLLADMLQAVNPNDRASVKDEIIVDLVNQCRSNQKKLMQMLTTTGDEELLGQGLELNDSMQSVLANHDAIATGSPLPTQVTNYSSQSVNSHELNLKSSEGTELNRKQNSSPASPFFAATKDRVQEEEDEEDDFALLARRHTKRQSTNSQDSSSGISESSTPMSTITSASSSVPASAPVEGNALVLCDPPTPTQTTKEQDMIDFLSLALTTTSVSTETPPTAPVSGNINQSNVSSTTQGYTYASQGYPANKGQVTFNSYVVPWAQPQPQPNHQLQNQTYSQVQAQSQPYIPQPQSQAYYHQAQPQAQAQLQPHMTPQAQAQAQAQAQSFSPPKSQSQAYPPVQAQPYSPPTPQSQVYYPQAQAQAQHQSQAYPQTQAQSQPSAATQLQPQSQPLFQPQPQLQQSQPQPQPHIQNQSQYPQFSSGYPPPPWAPTPGYFSNQNQLSTTSRMFSGPRANITTSYTTIQGSGHVNTLPLRGSNGLAMNGEAMASYSPRTTSPAFIPSYRLFEDLNVLGNGDGRFKMTSGTSPSLSGTPGQSMVAGRK
ncbi:hypothetical protein NMG60_11035962 [Bertholletia excelsa]